MQALLILSVSLVLFWVVTSFPGLRDWRTSITSRPRSAFFLLLALTITFLGSSETAQIDSLLSDPQRVARAILTSTLFTLSLYHIMQHPSSFRLAGAGARWMVYFSLIAIISASWSLGPFISGWKGFEILTLTLAVLSVSYQIRTEQDLRWLLNVLSASLLFVAISVLAGLLLFPSEAIKNPDTTFTEHFFSVRGIVPMLNPSSVGSIGALLFVSAFSKMLVSEKHQKAMSTRGLTIAMGIGIADLLISHSRTPIFAGTIAACLMLFYARKTRLLIIYGSLGAIALLTTTASEMILSYIYRGQSLESFTSLTGRIGFWEHVINQISSAPIIGHGYYAGQRILFGASTVDNTFLEVLLGTGIVGLIAFSIPIIYGIYQLRHSRPQTRTIANIDSLWLHATGLLGILLLRSLTAPTFQVMHPLFVVYITVQVAIAAICRLRKEPAQDFSAMPDDATPIRPKNQRILRRKKQ